MKAPDPDTSWIEPIASPQILLLVTHRNMGAQRLRRESVDYIFSRCYDLDPDCCATLYSRLKPGGAIHLHVPAGTEGRVSTRLAEAGFRAYGSVVLAFNKADPQGQWYSTTERLVLAGKGELQPLAAPPSDLWGFRKHRSYDSAARAVVERAMGLYCPDGGVVFDPAASEHGRVALAALKSERGAICFLPSEAARRQVEALLAAQRAQLALTFGG